MSVHEHGHQSISFIAKCFEQKFRRGTPYYEGEGLDSCNELRVVLFEDFFIVFKEMFEKSDNAIREHIHLASPSSQPIVCSNVRWSEICVEVDAVTCILETTLKNST